MGSGDSLRERQVAAIKRIINLNDPDTSETGDDAAHSSGNAAPTAPLPTFKILVFDNMGRDIISPVLSVSELRSLGVTLHLHISAPRATIPETPAIYLVEPTSANLTAITNDLQKGLYESAYINFLSSVPRPLLEDFAAQSAASGTSDKISKLFDQYLNFICLEPSLFTLGMQKEHTYYMLNSAKTSDQALEAVIDRTVTGLYSVVATMGVLPIVRSPRGGAAEMVATRLDRKLRDLYLETKDKDNLFSQGRPASSTPTSRPVMIICDRNLDLIPMLAHSWAYQSLLYDVLKVNLNRVTLETPADPNNPGRGSSKKTYDLESSDFFWQKNACLPFPLAADNIDSELTAYKEETTLLMKNTGVTNFEDLENENNANAQHLKNVVHQIPELQKKKKVLDNHMALLTAILGEIQARQLDNFFQLEENVAKQTKAQVMDLVKSGDNGKPADKLRFFIIWYLATEQDVSRQEWTEFQEALAAVGCDTTPLAYIRQVRAAAKMTQLTTVSTAGPSQQGPDLFGRFSAISSKFADRLKETGVPTNALSSNVASLLGGIKNFLPVDKDLTVTKIAESIMEPQSASSHALQKTESWLFFDPRSPNARGTMPQPSALRGQGGSSVAPGGLPGIPGPGTGASFGQRRQGFSEAIVFMVGGGSMEEYSNLQDWATRTLSTTGEKAKKKVIYGATELLNGSSFLNEELGRLGGEIS